MTDKNSDKFVMVEVNDQKVTKVKLGAEWKIIYLSLIPDLQNSFGIGFALLPVYIASYLILEFIFPQLNITILLSFFLPNFLYAMIRNKIFLHDCIEKNYHFILGLDTTKEDLERYLGCSVSNEIFIKQKHEDKNKTEHCFIDQPKKDNLQKDLGEQHHSIKINDISKISTCPECKIELNKDNANFCNNCGYRIKGNSKEEDKQNKNFRLKKRVWIPLTIFIIIIFNKDDKTSSPDRKSSAFSPSNDALVYCIIAAESAARFDSDVPREKNEFISQYPDGRYRVGLDVKYQNAFGTWEKKRVGCEVKGESVTKLNVGGQKVY